MISLIGGAVCFLIAALHWMYKDRIFSAPAPPTLRKLHAAGVIGLPVAMVALGIILVVVGLTTTFGAS